MGSQGFDVTADFGQESATFGKYIGVLATEYYLLSHYGRIQEAAITDQELQKALLAQRRRDLWEDHLGPPYHHIEDGLFCRQDFPPDEAAFYNSFILEEHKEVNTYAGVLLSSDPILENIGEIRKVKQIGNVQDPNYTLYEQMSQDEAIFTLEGLALAYHFGSSEASAIARNLAEKILTRCYGHWVENLNMFDWIIYGYNNITPVPDGNFCVGFSYGYASVSEYFNLPPMIPQPLAWEYWNLGCYNGWSGSTDAHMVASLAAIGNFWGNSLTQQAIYNNSDGDNNWREYYLWLHGALHDYYNPFGNFDVENVEDRLDEAPCVGPWKENNSNHASNGWASNDRWYHTQTEQMDGNFVTGVFSGHDYMILLNLYYICNVIGCTSCTDYNNYDNSILDNQWPQGNQGSISNPFIANAFRSIVSTETILSTPLQGEVEYHAGEEITLNSGFYAEKGCLYWASIRKMEYCGEGDFPDNESLMSLKNKEMDLDYQNNINKLRTSDDANRDKITINIFPNPTSGKITVMLSIKNAYELILESGKGIELFRKMETNQKITLGLENLLNGIYILKIKTNKEIFIRKIIKI